MDREQYSSPYSNESSYFAPEYNALTLEFTDRELEARYLKVMHQETAFAVRFGIALAIVLFAVFGVIDWWLVRDQAFAVWTVRGMVILVSAALFAVSFNPGFTRYREVSMASFVLLLSLGLSVICAMVPVEAANQYYVGHLLIIAAAYTLFGPRFPAATLASAVIFVVYVGFEHYRGDVTSPEAITHATFILSAVIVAGVGGYIGERQRRLAFYRNCIIERDRARNAYGALHDPLTGLPNRRLFMEKLAHAVARDQRFDSRCAVLFSDLDAFKAVNDRYGHVFGDKLLVCVAERLLDCMRTTDTVARFGGDEFVVLLEDVSSVEFVDELIGRITQLFECPFPIDGTEVSIVLSVGRALHPDDGGTPGELLEFADQAMYRMKLRHGRR